MTEGLTIWLTGLSGAGKTTIANALRPILEGRGLPTEVLDGDMIRTSLSKGLTFSKEDRIANILRIAFVAKLLTKYRVCVIVSAISPYTEARTRVKEMFENSIEVFVKCPLTICETRDVKGLYKKARNGEIENFTGLTDVYEEPINPSIICNTETESIEESVRKILAFLLDGNLLS